VSVSSMKELGNPNWTNRVLIPLKPIRYMFWMESTDTPILYQLWVQ